MSSNIGLVVNPKSGFVGIGTGRPSTLLHVDGNMLAAGTITASNLSILGDFVTLNTITSNTEQMVIQNAGTGPALKVTQTGAHPIADFYDDGNALAMRIADGGNVGIGTANPLGRLHVNGDVTITSTGALTIPRGTTAQRPTNPLAGMMRYNNDEGYIETYEPILSMWISISSFVGVLATGGTVTEIIESGIQYRVHSFTSAGTSSFQVLRGGSVEYVVIAGGGGGGSGVYSGGGGAGGYRSSVNAGLSGGGTSAESAPTLTIQSYTVTVGAGGAGGTTNSTDTGYNRGSQGNNSSIVGTDISIISTGGGGGGAYGNAANAQNNGGNGGCGGAGAGHDSVVRAGGLGTSNQGLNGGNGQAGSPYRGGGGGGAGQVGATGNTSGNGGNGIASSITGVSTFRSGGGGAGQNGSAVGSGGSGGGGNGQQAGTANTGGGGGGGDGGTNSAKNSFAGGSGIVMIRYRTG